MGVLWLMTCAHHGASEETRERETWAGTVGEEILEEGAVPTEQWRVGTIWRDRKKWERNSKRGYQVHEWRHTSRDKHAGPLEFILDRAIAVEEGLEEPSWRGKVSSDRGKTQMAGKVPLNLAHLIAHRELVMSVSVHFPGKQTVLLYTHTAQISKEAWAWMSEHGHSSEHTRVFWLSYIVVHTSAMPQLWHDQSLQDQTSNGSAQHWEEMH